MQMAWKPRRVSEFPSPHSVNIQIVCWCWKGGFLSHGGTPNHCHWPWLAVETGEARGSPHRGRSLKAGHRDWVINCLSVKKWVNQLVHSVSSTKSAIGSTACSWLQSLQWLQVAWVAPLRGIGRQNALLLGKICGSCWTFDLGAQQNLWPVAKARFIQSLRQDPVGWEVAQREDGFVCHFSNHESNHFGVYAILWQRLLFDL